MRKTAIGTYAMVPIAILQDPSVTLKMLRVYMAISSFQGSNEKCWPSREGIAERSGMKSRPDISSAITALVNTGWIIRVRRPQNHKTNIYKVRFVAEDVEIIEGSGNADIQKSECMRNDHPEGMQTADIPLYEKNKEKNSKENGEAEASLASSAREEPQKKEELGGEETGQLEEVISHLNSQAGRSFRASRESTRKFLRGRFRDGYSVEDMKAVIDNQVREWLGDPKMERYLRPETLFNATKFEGYYQVAMSKRSKKLIYSTNKGLDLPDEWYE